MLFQNQEEKENKKKKASERGLISYKGGWYSVLNRYKIQGKNNLLNRLDNESISNSLLDFLAVDQKIINDLNKRILELEQEIQALHEEAAEDDL